MFTTNQAIGDYVIKMGPFGGLSGFGELYKAAHVSDPSNLVAFKLSKHQTADDELRFRLENEILHELKGHKGIIDPHTGILEDKKLGILYYCMELIQGGKHRCDRQCDAIYHRAGYVLEPRFYICKANGSALIVPKRCEV